MKRPWYSLGYLSHGTLSGGSVLVGGAGRTSIFEGSLLGGELVTRCVRKGPFLVAGVL